MKIIKRNFRRSLWFFKQEPNDSVVSTLKSIIFFLGFIGLGFYLKNSYKAESHVMLIANFLISTGFVGIPYAIYLRVTFRKESIEIFYAALQKFDKLYQSTAEHGIIGFQSELVEEDFKEKMKKAKTIKILDTWIGNNQNILEYIRKRIADPNSVTIQILLLQNEEIFSKDRTKTLSEKGEDVCKGIESNLKNLEAIKKSIDKKKLPHDLEVRLYNHAASFPIYWIDDICYIGYFFRGEYAAQQMQIKIDMNQKTLLKKNIQHHFNSLWKECLKSVI